MKTIINASSVKLVANNASNKIHVYTALQNMY